MTEIPTDTGMTLLVLNQDQFITLAKMIEFYLKMMSDPAVSSFLSEETMEAVRNDAACFQSMQAYRIHHTSVLESLG